MIKDDLIKAIGYVRVSTNKQDFERQKDEINLYAKNNGFLIVKIFEDKQSGSDYADRSGFQDALTFLKESDDVKIILFDEISRMGRDTAEQVVTYKQLSKIDVRVYTKGKGEFGKNKEDTLLFTVLSAIAEYEKQTIIDRTSSGMRRAVREGATHLSVRKFGYNTIHAQRKDRVVISRQRVEINKKEAPYVKKMFEIIDQGGAVRDVMRYLNGKIKTTKGNDTWGSTTVLNCLHSTTYYGDWQYRKFVKNGRTKYSLSKRPKEDLIISKVPPIIDRDLFERVQLKLHERKTKLNPRNQKYIFLLKGLTNCHCGKMIQTQMSSKSIVKTREYRCPERNIEGLSEKTCPIIRIKADFIEKILLQELKKKIENPDFLKDSKLRKLENYRSPLLRLQKQQGSLLRGIEKDDESIKVHYQKYADLYGSNPEKAKYFETLADNLLEKIKKAKSDVKQLDIEI